MRKTAPDLPRLHVAYRRLHRLELMAADPGYTASLVARGRALRLSAAIAWASDNVARLSASVPTLPTRDCQVLH